MKKIFLMSAVFAAMCLTSCADETIDKGIGKGANSGVAYLSIKVDTRSGTRTSAAHEGTNESGLQTFYFITFDASGNVVPVPGSSNCYTLVDATVQTDDKKPAAIKISAASKNLVVVANPGDKLATAIMGLTAAGTYETFNAVIAGITTDDIAGANGFTMITSGDDTGLAAEKQILYPYVSIGNKIQIVSGSKADEDAQRAAQEDKNRLDVKLERLAAKLVVMAHPTKIAAPNGASVELTDWTVDAVNSIYYPFAEKTLIDPTHTGSDYTKNFYTKDPNFTSDPDLGYASGLVYATIDATTYAPVLPWTDATYPDGYYKWKTPGTAAVAYVIENTMTAAEQKFGSATRIIMKATYYPAACNEGDDWFQWAGTDYPSLVALQKAYTAPNATTALKDACTRFLARVKVGNPAITTDDFTALTQIELDAVRHGGQVVKEGNTPVIRWFQKGQCYYSYEIRHDNDANTSMAVGKYGVVRNNWYDLTLNSVKGPGTPWYPEVVNPGPGDPDPKDLIDMQSGYLGVSVKINQWMIWKTDMENVD